MPGIGYFGPAGSYKTSMMLDVWLKKFFLEGRRIITNVDGLKEKGLVLLKKEFPKSKSKIVCIPSTTPADILRWQKFYHQGEAIAGCVFFIDEIQTIFPPTLTAKDFVFINEGNDAAIFHDFSHFCSWHRHKNIDFLVTSTHKSFCHKIIFLNLQSYYVHQNQDTIGLNKIIGKPVVKIKYFTQGERNFSSIETKIINKDYEKIFNYYESTKENDVKHSPFQVNSIPLTIYLLLIFLVLILCFIFYRVYNIFYVSEEPLSLDISKDSLVVIQSDLSSSQLVSNNISSSGTGDEVSKQFKPFNHPNSDFLSSIIMVYHNGIVKIGDRKIKVNYKIKNEDETYIELTNYELREIGIKSVYYNKCFSTLTQGTKTKYVGCFDEYEFDSDSSKYSEESSLSSYLITSDTFPKNN